MDVVKISVFGSGFDVVEGCVVAGVGFVEFVAALEVIAVYVGGINSYSLGVCEYFEFYAASTVIFAGSVQVEPAGDMDDAFQGSYVV